MANPAAFIEDTRKVMVARQGEDWQIMDWSKDVEVMQDVKVNIVRIIDES